MSNYMEKSFVNTYNIWTGRNFWTVNFQGHVQLDLCNGLPKMV